MGSPAPVATEVPAGAPDGTTPPLAGDVLAKRLVRIDLEALLPEIIERLGSPSLQGDRGSDLVLLLFVARSGLAAYFVPPNSPHVPVVIWLKPCACPEDVP